MKSSFLFCSIIIAVYIAIAVICGILGQIIFNYLEIESASNLAYFDSALYGIIHTVIFWNILNKTGLPTIKGTKLKSSIYFVFSSMVIIALFSNAVASLFSYIGVSEASLGYSAENGNLILEFASLVIIGPISEELVFRGAIYGKLRESHNFFGAAVISSTIFALLHGFGPVTINAFMIGMVLCLTFEKTKSLIPCFIIHACNNILAIFSNGEAVIKVDSLFFALVPLAISLALYYIVYKEDWTEKMGDDR